MKTYRVEPENRKATVEVTTMTHPDYDDLEVAEVYRWGEFDITPTNDAELNTLMNCKSGDTFKVSDFDDCEMVEMFDISHREGVSENMDQEVFDSLMEESDDFDIETLEDMGWTYKDCEVIIYDGVTVEEI